VSLEAGVHVCISVWLLVNIAFHYAMAVSSSAGSPPRDDAATLEEAHRKYPEHYRYCRHCATSRSRLPF
jgi:hypothetical protein